jgi:hypothetical protein
MDPCLLTHPYLNAARGVVWNRRGMGAKNHTPFPETPDRSHQTNLSRGASGRDLRVKIRDMQVRTPFKYVIEMHGRHYLSRVELGTAIEDASSVFNATTSFFFLAVAMAWPPNDSRRAKGTWDGSERAV